MDIICKLCEKEQIRVFGELVDCPFEYKPIYNCYRNAQPRCSYCGEEYEDRLIDRLCNCEEQVWWE